MLKEVRMKPYVYYKNKPKSNIYLHKQGEFPFAFYTVKPFTYCLSFGTPEKGS